MDHVGHKTIFNVKNTFSTNTKRTIKFDSRCPFYVGITVISPIFTEYFCADCTLRIRVTHPHAVIYDNHQSILGRGRGSGTLSMRRSRHLKLIDGIVSAPSTHASCVR